MAEHWWLKPEALGSIPGGTTFFLSLCRFKGLRTVTPRLSLSVFGPGEPRLSGSQCCDKSSRFFRNHKHTQQISPIYHSCVCFLYHGSVITSQPAQHPLPHLPITHLPLHTALIPTAHSPHTHNTCTAHVALSLLCMQCVSLPLSLLSTAPSTSH